MRAKDLALTTGPVDRRVANTLMDTDAQDAQEYYAVMTFRDETQLDHAYAFLADTPAVSKDAITRSYVKQSVANPVFTCWQDID